MQNKFGIYGASGHAKVIIEILENLGMGIEGLYTDVPERVMVFEYKVTNDKSILQLSEISWIIGVGDNTVRKKITETYDLNYGMAIDKSASISSRSGVGEGSVIMPGVAVNTSSAIGRHVILNTNSSVDHECVVNDFVHLSPNATLCGNVFVGEGTHIGAGAVVIPGIKIGKWCTIGAGSVIIRDVPDFSKVVGNPGRLITSKM